MSDHDDEVVGHEEEGEPWLVSYADLMTLLFGFFVLMYTFAAAKNQDDEGMVRLRKEIAKYFGGTYTTPLEKTAKEFEEKIQAIIGEGMVEILQHPEGLDITFKSTVLFNSGEAILLPRAREVVEILVDELKKRSQLEKVLVEGHTDNVPIKYSKIYPSNWELSGARASTVIRIFESKGFSSSILTAIGYGESRPLYPNEDENGNPDKRNQALNRRVVVKILVDPKTL